MASQASTQYACTTTVVGLGNQFDPGVLRAIASAGRGSYHVARDATELGPVLRAELRAQMRISVRDVRLNVSLPSGVEIIGDDAGGSRTTDGVVWTMPQLRENEERRIVVRVRVRGGVGQVARVRLGFRRGGRPHVATKDVRVRFGATGQLTGSASALAVVDKDLGRAIDEASAHVLNGRHQQASAVLRAHVQRSSARAGFRNNRRLRIRTQAVGRFATALGQLVQGASHTERREVSLAMGGLAMRLLR